MKRILLLFSIIILIINCYGQDQHIVDSLQKELKNFEATKKVLGNKAPKMFDTTKVNILEGLSDEYGRNNPDTGMIIIQQQLILSEKIGYKKGISDAYYEIGYIQINKRNYR